MSIQTKVLGLPGFDNALFTTIDTGQNQHHIMVDCGEVPFNYLGNAVLQKIDFLLISHCHMDHICGFDSLFRHLYAKRTPLHILGPNGITDIMHHRFQGYTWNLVQGKLGVIYVHEINEEKTTINRFFCKEKYKIRHFVEERETSQIGFKHEDFQIECAILDHRIDCMGYALVEPTKININSKKLIELGYQPGPWCSDLKNLENLDNQIIQTSKGSEKLGALREKFLDKNQGQRIAYATDIIMHKKNHSRLGSISDKADELVIECSYASSDIELAKKNYHLTVSESAQFASDYNIKKLTLFHVSDRYSRQDRKNMLLEAQNIHSNVSFPNHWN